MRVFRRQFPAEWKISAMSPFAPRTVNAAIANNRDAARFL